MVGRTPQSGEFQDHVMDKFKGFHSSGPSSLEEDTHLSMAKNVLIGSNGELCKRPGAITYASGANANTFPAGIYSIPITSGSYQNKLIGIPQSPSGGPISGRISQSANSGQTWAFISSATAHQYQPPFQYQGALYGVSDAGIWKWDGTAFTDYINAAQYPTSTKKSAFIQFRMFVINATGSIQYSNPLSWTGTTDWTSGGGGGQISFPGDGQDVVGIIAFRDNLVIFRTRSIYVLQMAGASNPSSWSLKELSFQIGCTAERAMWVYKDILFFVSVTGVYATDLITLNRISEPIDKAFVGRAAQLSMYGGGGGVGSAANAQVSLNADQIVVYNNKLFCIVNITGLNARQHMEDNGVSNAAMASTLLNLETLTTAVYVYDLIQKVWTEFEFQMLSSVNLSLADPALGTETWKIQPGLMYVVPNSLGQNAASGYINEGIYFLWNYNNSTFLNRIFHYSESTHVRDLALETPPYVHSQYLSYTDPDGNYPVRIRTKNLDFDLPNSLKRCPLLSVGINSGESHNTASVNTSITVNYYMDDVLVSATTALINSTTSKQSKVKGPGFFRKVMIEFLDTSNGYFEIINIVPSVRAKRKLTETRT